MLYALLFFFFFFNDTATTEIYTLSLHDALPISPTCAASSARRKRRETPAHRLRLVPRGRRRARRKGRSEEHTSELQSQSNLVCRLLLEKKKKKRQYNPTHIITNHTQSKLRHRML